MSLLYTTKQKIEADIKLAATLQFECPFCNTARDITVNKSYGHATLKCVCNGSSAKVEIKSRTLEELMDLAKKLNINITKKKG